MDLETTGAGDLATALMAAFDRGDTLPDALTAELRARLTPPEVPDELVVMLKKPVTIGAGQGKEGISYDRLELREPNAGEMIEFLKLSGPDSDMLAVQLISGLPKPALERISARDFNKATRYLSSFLA